MTLIQLYLPAAAVAFGLALLWRFVSLPSAEGSQLDLDLQELSDARSHVRDVDLQRSIVERVIGPLGKRVTRQLHRITPVGRLEALQHKLELAGAAESRWTPEAIMGVKIALTLLTALLAAAILATGISSGTLLQATLIVGIGYAGPDVLLKRKVDDRQKRIQQDLPDTLDQITVTVEAGLGFDGAIQRAGEEGKGPLAEELVKVVGDLQLGMTREEALDALLERTSVPDLRGFVLSIKQATRYGLPIARVLRVQSNEMREKRRARAEEKAMQIPVKITFPLVFFILPALFICILGPAALQISGNY